MDVAIVGLGPAGGSVLKYLTAQSDHAIDPGRIIAIDRRKIVGTPVACGELMPSVAAMRRLTPRVLEPEDVYAVDSKYQTMQHRTVAFIAPNGWSISTPFDSFTMDRASWNQDLVSAAEEAEVQVYLNSRATRFTGSELTVRQGTELLKIRATVFIAADGVNSLFNRNLRDQQIVWCRQHQVERLDCSYDPSHVLMFFGSQYAPGAYGWIIPKGEDMANVGIGVRREYLTPNTSPRTIIENLWKHPVAKKVLEGSKIVSSISASVPVGLPPVSAVKDHILFVGDSASQVISHVGAGIPPAMVAGREAARAIVAHLSENQPLLTYDHEWRSQLLDTMKASYKLRRIWDRISATDSRMQWYLRRLSKKDLDSVVHGRIPLKLRMGTLLIPLTNKFVR
ncbi:MAG: geranylgeranyl reductase family protein [Candidatus Thorarchaeota archaeon]